MGQHLARRRSGCRELVEPFHELHFTHQAREAPLLIILRDGPDYKPCRMYRFEAKEENLQCHIQLFIGGAKTGQNKQ